MTLGKVKRQPRVCLPYTFQQVCILWNINCNLSSYRTEDEIRPGAYYDPQLLPDYGGPCFDHREARLKQLDIHDEEKKIDPSMETLRCTQTWDNHPRRHLAPLLYLPQKDTQ